MNKVSVLFLGAFSMQVAAQKLSPEDDIVKRWVLAERPGAAAAFLDAIILISEDLAPTERIRLLLLDAVTQAQTRRFSTAYRRVHQAQDLVESVREPDAGRIRSSIDLVLHDIRRSEAEETRGNL